MAQNPNQNSKNSLYKKKQASKIDLKLLFIEEILTSSFTHLNDKSFKCFYRPAKRWDLDDNESDMVKNQTKLFNNRLGYYVIDPVNQLLINGKIVNNKVEKTTLLGYLNLQDELRMAIDLLLDPIFTTEAHNAYCLNKHYMEKGDEKKYQEKSNLLRELLTIIDSIQKDLKNDDLSMKTIITSGTGKLLQIIKKIYNNPFIEKIEKGKLDSWIVFLAWEVDFLLYAIFKNENILGDSYSKTRNELIQSIEAHDQLLSKKELKVKLEMETTNISINMQASQEQEKNINNNKSDKQNEQHSDKKKEASPLQDNSLFLIQMRKNNPTNIRQQNQQRSVNGNMEGKMEDKSQQKFP